MAAIFIIIVLILLLKSIVASNAASKTPVKTVTVPNSSCGSAGENFTSGSGVVAGVHEPPTPIHCQHIVVGQFGGYSGLPIHVTYPVPPPPIKITTPVPVRSYPRPAPMPVRPMPIGPIYGRPIYRAALPGPASCISCSLGGGGPVYCFGGGGGGSGRSCLGGGGLCGGGDIIASY